MIKLAIFASGSGSNAENIFHYFKDNSSISVTTLVCNKSDAGVWNRFEKIDIEKIQINKNDLSSQEFLDSLQDIDCIILAGFLLLIPKELISMFKDKIINIHPSLLPKFGGKGMYGKYVHEAVLANHEKETGITIHLVNEIYDEGKILFQAKFNILDSDDLSSIQSKIHVLEQAHFPSIIEDYLEKIKK